MSNPEKERVVHTMQVEVAYTILCLSCIASFFLGGAFLPNEKNSDTIVYVKRPNGGSQKIVLQGQGIIVDDIEKVEVVPK